MVLALASCGGSKQVASNSYDVSRRPQTTNPFGDVYTAPGFEPDTDEYFAALGTANGPRERMDVLQQSALSNAQNLVRQKMKHAYQGMVSEYSNNMGIGANSDAARNFETAGDQIIDVIVNDTQARSVQFSGVDEKGNVSCFVAIRVMKKEVADKIADKISKDEELKLRYDEQQYREKMLERFRQYRENGGA